jgi:hypothetical protein
MKKLTFAVLALSVLLCGSARAEGGGMFFGTSLGVTHFIPEDGDGLTAATWPSQAGFYLPTFMPGLRVGGFLDEAHQQSLYLDTGLFYATSDGNSLMNLQGLLAYEFAFGDQPTVPIVNVGVGVLHVGDDDDSYNSMVIGGGLGLRHRLAHGHGALRAEVHVDRQFEAEDNGHTVLPALTAVGAKLGFDVYLK